MRQDGMRVREARSDVVWPEIGVVSENRFGALTLREQTKDRFNGNSQSTNDGLPPKNIGVGRDVAKKTLVGHRELTHSGLRASRSACSQLAG